MTIVAGIDVGSTYAKAVLAKEDGTIVASVMQPTGFRIPEIAEKVFHQALEAAGLLKKDVAYVVATGMGRHQVAFKDVHVTDLTASARGAHFYFPKTRTVLDIGGQTVKSSRLDENVKVRSFRLNDKCAAGTGAFLEKTGRYMGYETAEISNLLETSKDPVEISGVCAVFAESEVINQLSIGTPPADIMLGAIESLSGRSVQLLKRVRGEAEFTLIGGILRFAHVADSIKKLLKHDVNVVAEAKVQFVAAHGAAILGHRRLLKLAEDRATRSAQGQPTEQSPRA
ncbi:MAG: 2-hydroxyglutaryl-CoA dehydratase [Myxococcales bacterium]|nr:2-hydroxyglutaryl-CoA dehydratase [Myxococcales bacterium]